MKQIMDKIIASQMAKHLVHDGKCRRKKNKEL